VLILTDVKIGKVFHQIIFRIRSDAGTFRAFPGKRDEWARPDVLVCGLAMPREDGYTALLPLRDLEAARGVAAHRSIPAIALPALASDEDRLRALSAGFQFHFAEPADPVELTIVIANLAGMWL
jgi:CheY-like chemotaxis protein